MGRFFITNQSPVNVNRICAGKTGPTSVCTFGRCACSDVRLHFLEISLTAHQAPPYRMAQKPASVSRKYVDHCSLARNFSLKC